MNSTSDAAHDVPATPTCSLPTIRDLSSAESGSWRKGTFDDAYDAKKDAEPRDALPTVLPPLFQLFAHIAWWNEGNPDEKRSAICVAPIAVSINKTNSADLAVSQTQPAPRAQLPVTTGDGEVTGSNRRATMVTHNHAQAITQRSQAWATLPILNRTLSDIGQCRLTYGLLNKPNSTRRLPDVPTGVDAVDIAEQKPVPRKQPLAATGDGSTSRPNRIATTTMHNHSAAVNATPLPLWAHRPISEATTEMAETIQVKTRPIVHIKPETTLMPRAQPSDTASSQVKQVSGAMDSVVDSSDQLSLFTAKSPAFEQRDNGQSVAPDSALPAFSLPQGLRIGGDAQTPAPAPAPSGPSDTRMNDIQQLIQQTVSSIGFDANQAEMTITLSPTLFNNTRLIIRAVGKDIEWKYNSDDATDSTWFASHADELTERLSIALQRRVTLQASV